MHCSVEGDVRFEVNIPGFSKCLFLAAVGCPLSSSIGIVTSVTILTGVNTLPSIVLVTKRCDQSVGSQLELLRPFFIHDDIQRPQLQLELVLWWMSVRRTLKGTPVDGNLSKKSKATRSRLEIMIIFPKHDARKRDRAISGRCRDKVTVKGVGIILPKQQQPCALSVFLTVRPRGRLGAGLHACDSAQPRQTRTDNQRSHN